MHTLGSKATSSNLKSDRIVEIIDHCIMGKVQTPNPVNVSLVFTCSLYFSFLLFSFMSLVWSCELTLKKNVVDTFLSYFRTNYCSHGKMCIFFFSGILFSICLQLCTEFIVPKISKYIALFCKNARVS